MSCSPHASNQVCANSVIPCAGSPLSTAWASCCATRCQNSGISAWYWACSGDGPSSLILGMKFPIFLGNWGSLLAGEDACRQSACEAGRHPNEVPRPPTVAHPKGVTLQNGTEYQRAFDVGHPGAHALARADAERQEGVSVDLVGEEPIWAELLGVGPEPRITLQCILTDDHLGSLRDVVTTDLVVDDRSADVRGRGLKSLSFVEAGPQVLQLFEVGVLERLALQRIDFGVGLAKCVGVAAEQRDGPGQGSCRRLEAREHQTGGFGSPPAVLQLGTAFELESEQRVHQIRRVVGWTTSAAVHESVEYAEERGFGVFTLAAQRVWQPSRQEVQRYAADHVRAIAVDAVHRLVQLVGAQFHLEHG